MVSSSRPCYSTFAVPGDLRDVRSESWVVIFLVSYQGYQHHVSGGLEGQGGAGRVVATNPDGDVYIINKGE